jgi:hypothetical protein
VPTEMDAKEQSKHTFSLFSETSFLDFIVVWVLASRGETLWLIC